MTDLNQNYTPKIPWYYNSWVILILAVLGGKFIFTAIVAAVLLILRRKKFALVSTEDAARVAAIDTLRSELEQEQSALDEEKASRQSELTKLQTAISNYQTILKDLEANISIALTTPEVDMDIYEGMTSSEIKNELILLSNREKDLVKRDAATTITNAANTMKESEIRRQKNQLLRGFNAESDNLIKDVTARNIDTIRSRINRAYESYNKLFAQDGVSISQELLKSKLSRMECFYQYQLKLIQEKELLQAQKEQIREEEKVRREIEEAKKKIARDEMQYHNEINRLMSYMQKSSLNAEKQLYVDKIKELEEKLSKLEKEKETVNNQEANAKAGFVYIISNIGSFGENVYKIGMTRRLEPMDRIRELSSASVPFEFDVHAIIFSDNAPELESLLHQKFRSHEVNKVNHRKEFFKVALDEIEKTVKENYNNTVTFIRIPKAEEYRESLRLALSVESDS